uniref:Uncharacterized protein n=1 Tax=Meloidogyne enterolobii TaxID=390850 RepID=A0A6V7VEP4_MELEN|nr:unnamed protein product [Meloidogyne enterolobii]
MNKNVNLVSLVCCLPFFASQKMKSGAAKTKSSEGKTKGDEQQQQQQKKSASNVKSSGSKDSLPAGREDSDLCFSSVSQASVIEREPKSSTPVTPPMQSRPLPVANLSMIETGNSDSVNTDDDDNQRKRQGVASIWKLPKGADVNKDPRSSNYS